MKIKICFFENTITLCYKDGRKETFQLTTRLWKLICWLTENGWKAEVYPASVILTYS